MSLNCCYYGIFLGYQPGVDLRYEGLGRQLAAFLKGAESLNNVRFEIVCPSWSKKTLLDLFVSEDVNLNNIKIRSPRKQSIILFLYENYHAYFFRRKTKKSRFFNVLLKPSEFINWLNNMVLANIVTQRNLIWLIINVLMWIFFVAPFLLLNILLQKSSKIINKILRTSKILKQIKQKLGTILNYPKRSNFLFNLYQSINQREQELMIQLINKLTHVQAWYSPTAFWPMFNQIQAPKLMCVPDIVVTEFPIEFAISDGGLLPRYKNIEKAISESDYFVTYSQQIKETILIEKYNIPTENINVIPHAVNNLNHCIKINTQQVNETNSTKRYAQQLLLQGLNKSAYHNYTQNFKNTEIKYLFYASQFRPSKNILTLLKAYKYLLRYHFLPHKLILTGRLNVLKEIDNYIKDNILEHDVILISNLSVKELAATYHLADLAINPSLSEGGCPFTFSEALSVNTPVVMANIAVTKEIIQDAELQNNMLFDPYDWHDLVKKIIWALENKETLLAQQLTVFNQIKQRTWTTVVEDYVKVLNKISGNKENNPHIHKKKYKTKTKVNYDVIK